MNLSNNFKGILFASGAAFLWGMITVFIKFILNYVPPSTIAWLRFLIAFLILVSFYLFRKSSRSEIFKRPPLLVIVSGIFLGLNYILYMKGIQNTTPNNAAVFIQSGPLLLAIIGIFIYKEKLKILQIIGFVIAIAGFIIFYHEQMNNLFKNSEEYNLGVLFVLIAGVMWAFYSVIQKELIKKNKANHLNLFNFGIPVLLISPLFEPQPLINTPWYGILIIIFLGFNTVIAYYFLALALKYTEANKVSIIITCNPTITFLIMAFLTSFNIKWAGIEVFSFYTILGAFMVILGAVMVSLLSRVK